MDGDIPSPEVLWLSDPLTLDDLGPSLHRLRRRFAWRRHDAIASYRYLAQQTGYAHSAIAEYFAGTVLPPPDKLDALVVRLGADERERLTFAAARDAVEQRRRVATAAAIQPGTVNAQTAASRYLYDLLFGREQYRVAWKRYLTSRAGPIGAITMVVARYLAGTREVVQEPERLRGRIARALSGESADMVLSSTTLEWFVEAFAMLPDDAGRLRELRAGAPGIRYVRGASEETRLPIFDLRQMRYRTVDLREYHYLGPDGMPLKHRTDRIVEAADDGLDHYVYMVDTSMLTVDVENGGTPGRPYRIRAQDGDIYHAVDIAFDQPLAAGETAVLNYTTTLRYHEPPAPEMRYAFRARVDKFMLWVQFHPDKLPAALWWAEWNAITDGEVIHREEVKLTASHAAHRFLEGGAEGAIVGFCWEW